MNIRNTLSSWNKVDCVRFAVWCARRIVHLNNDPRVVAAIEAAERWLQDPSEANKSAAQAAARAADGAADAVDAAAYVARTAARAAANAAYSIAYSAGYAATNSASNAAYAATNAAGGGNISLTEHDLLHIYLSEVVMSEVIHGS